MLNKYRGSHLIGAFILLQLIVCLPFINSFPIDLDEPFSIFHAQKDLSDLFVIFTQENNPPLHFILLHFWIKLFGISPLAVRSLSLIFSIITIPILYQFSKKIVKQPFAILVVFLYIFSTQIHYHSLEARTYSLLVLLTVAAFNQLFDFIFNDKANFFQLAVINALLLYTHYLSGYIILTQIIILLLFKRNYVRKKIIQAIISYILMTILYTPGIWIFMLRLKHFSSQGTWVPEAKLIELPVFIIKFFNKEFAFVMLILVIISLFIYKIKQKVKFDKISPEVLFVGYIFILNFFGLFLFSVFLQPVFLLRYLVFIIPFYFILIAYLLSYLYPTKINLYHSFIILIPYIFTMQFIPDNNREGDRIAYIVNKKIKQQKLYRIYICPPWYNLTFYYHFDKKLFKNTDAIGQLKETEHIKPVYSFDEITISEETQQVIFVDAYSNFLFSNNNIKSEFNDNFVLKDSIHFKGDYIVYEFIKYDN